MKVIMASPRFLPLESWCKQLYRGGWQGSSGAVEIKERECVKLDDDKSNNRIL